MKHLKLSFFGLMLLLFCGRVQAQWVTIPQSFATYIATYIDPTAISGSQLDTTNNSVLTLQDLTIYTSTANDISGIKYFKGLKNLIYSASSGAPIAAIPELPPFLETLEVQASLNGNVMTSIYGFPPTLLVLKLQFSCVTSWPPLPLGFQRLHLEYSCIDSLPTLPNTVDSLFLNHCANLTLLPNVLPDSLRYLTALECDIRSVPALPPNLNTLDVTDNIHLNSIGILNGKLQTLSANHTAITSIPGIIPNSIFYLDLGNSALATLQALPDTMAYLNIEHTPITQLANIPRYLHLLFMDSLVNLSSLPNFLVNCPIISVSYNPNLLIDSLLSSNKYNENAYSLMDSLLMYYSNPVNGGQEYYSTTNPEITANNDSLTRVPIIQSSYIAFLDLSHNDISILDSSWLSKVEIMDLSYNNIDSFVVGSIRYVVVTSLNLSNNHLSKINSLPGDEGSSLGLDLSNNQITEINADINFQIAHLQNNRLTCLPYFKPVTGVVYAAGNLLTCIPNIPTTGFALMDTVLPICGQVNNTNNCSSTGTISGTLFNDINGNGVFDAGDTVLPQQTIYIESNSESYSASTNSAGKYLFTTPLNVIDTVSAFFPIVTTPNIYSSLSSAWQIDSNRNMGVQFVAAPHYDLGVAIDAYTVPRPYFNYVYNITCYNAGSWVQDGNAVLSFDTALVYQGSSTGGTVSGNTVTSPVMGLSPGQSINFNAQFVILATIPLGTLISSTITANSNYPDTNLLNNSALITDLVVGSYDPNEKVVQPAVLSQAQIDSLDYLTYTVRFQNTGTASAINIKVQDTISPLADLRTLKVVTTSHNANWYLNGRILNVEFNNINLPDSTTNEPMSHGFFTYSIHLDSTFDNTKTISNTAYIYFDFNQPVATNTTQTGKITGIGEVATTFSNNLQLYPNPTNDQLSIHWIGSGAAGLLHMEVVNTLGQTVDRFTVAGNATYKLSVKNYASGVYLLHCYTDGHQQASSQRFVVGH